MPILEPENGFLGIIWRWSKYFLNNICRNICSKNFECRLTNKKLMFKIIFEYAIFNGKLARKGSQYCPGKFYQSEHFIQPFLESTLYVIKQ